jgi:nucleotide-binding universal stress UspA family protein
MTVLVAAPDSPEGIAALAAAAAEAQLLGVGLVAVNLALTPLDTSSVPESTKVTVVERPGKSDRDPVDAVLADIEEYGAQRLVIGVRRRTPVGKAILGSVSQRLLLEAPIPVLAVKLDGSTDGS